MFSTKNLSKALLWLIFHTIGFLVLVWIFFGFTPQEAYAKGSVRVRQLYQSLVHGTNNFTKVTNSMSRVAKHHLNEADERTRGIDPYERYNRQVDRTTRQGTVE